MVSARTPLSKAYSIRQEKCLTNERIFPNFQSYSFNYITHVLCNKMKKKLCLVKLFLGSVSYMLLRNALICQLKVTRTFLLPKENSL